MPTPELPDWLLGVWRAWHRLNMDRPWYGGGMGPLIPGSISWAAVRDWCDFHGLPGGSVAFYDKLLQEMDAEYADFRAMQSASPSL